MRATAKRKTTVHLGKNLKMDSAVYAMRRRVMGFIYEAKALTGGTLPRVEIRVTDKLTGADGCAYVGGFSIFVPQHAVEYSDNRLRAIVFHEIVHAAFNFKGHNERCVLMQRCFASPDEYYTQEVMSAAFIKYAKRHSKVRVAA